MKIASKIKKSVSGLKPRSISLPPARSHETNHSYQQGYLFISSNMPAAEGHGPPRYAVFGGFEAEHGTLSDAQNRKGPVV